MWKLFVRVHGEKDFILIPRSDGSNGTPYMYGFPLMTEVLSFVNSSSFIKISECLIKDSEIEEMVIKFEEI